jgi:hypothetical protein
MYPDFGLLLLAVLADDAFIRKILVAREDAPGAVSGERVAAARRLADKPQKKLT